MLKKFDEINYYYYYYYYYHYYAVGIPFQIRTGLVLYFIFYQYFSILCEYMCPNFACKLVFSTLFVTLNNHYQHILSCVVPKQKGACHIIGIKPRQSRTEGYIISHSGCHNKIKWGLLNVKISIRNVEGNADQVK